MSRHRYHHVARRNPAMGKAFVPIALVAAGLYLLHRGTQAAGAIPATPVNGILGGLGQLGFSFSNFVQTAGNAVKQSIVAPIQVAARVAVAPVKLSTGSSWSSVVSGIKAPVQAAAAAVRAASPGHIMGKGGTSSSTNGSTTQYYDAQNNVITAAQYNALQQAVSQGTAVGPVTDASGIWWALPTGVTTSSQTVAAQYGGASTATSPVANVGVPTYWDGNGNAISQAHYNYLVSVGMPAQTIISNSLTPAQTQAWQAEQTTGDLWTPPAGTTISPTTGQVISTSGTATSIASYTDPNGQTLTLAQYDAEMAALGLAPSTAISGVIQVPQPTSAAQAASITSAAQATAAPPYASAAFPAPVYAGAPVVDYGGGGSGGSGGSFTDPNYNAQGTSIAPDGSSQDPSQGPGGTPPQPDPNAPAGVPVATATPTNWLAVGGAVVAVPVIMHFMNK
jgi:hypothetical protein